MECDANQHKWDKKRATHLGPMMKLLRPEAEEPVSALKPLRLRFSAFGHHSETDHARPLAHDIDLGNFR